MNTVETGPADPADAERLAIMRRRVEQSMADEQPSLSETELDARLEAFFAMFEGNASGSPPKRLES